MSFFINVYSNGSMERVEAHTPIMGQEVLDLANVSAKESVVAWRVNRILRPLGWIVDSDAEVEFVSISTFEGLEIYRRTLTFLMALACKKVLSDDIFVRYSMDSSYYCELKSGDATREQADTIKTEMNRLISMNLPIHMAILSLDRASDIFSRQGDLDKSRLMQWTGMDPITVYRCAGMYGHFGMPLASSTAIAKTFDVILCEPGLLLRFPSINDPCVIPPISTTAPQMGVFREYSEWLSLLGVTTMDSLHDRVANGASLDLVLCSEAFHSEALARIARHIIDKGQSRLVCIAGPSSSGKTTTSKRLSIQLQIYGKNPVPVELDNYYVDRKHVPLDESGQPDFETIDAIDVPLINKNLNDLLKGKEVQLPKYDFHTGTRKHGSRLKLRPNDILIIEGIHGLNDRVGEDIPRDGKYRVFVSPLTGVSIDTYNRIGTTDIRLIRRLVRDYRTRGHSPERTLSMWPSVVRGAHRHVFPYQQSADTLFNSSLVYEIGVLKGYAEPLLRSVHESSPVYGEARRLLSMLSFSPVIPSENIPNISILREFIGGSCFY
ncbi:nucleoside kinase [Synergistales bacterium]|nr:nucleoside kinase [Synergistales bacterium]